MADSSGKRMREAKKRHHRDVKAQRKQLRKDGLLGNDTSGLFAPGEIHREVINASPPVEPPPPAEPPPPPAPQR
ncbi:MAG TPA: hypothetical protein VE981_18455 [Planctomycetota bacterium]|nr:hypothetical protein [Planctomycetota bacterium]